MRRVHDAWVVAAVGFVTLITSAGFRSTNGVLIVPLQNEFGWSRATLGFAVSLNLFMFGLGGPFVATGAISVQLAAMIANRWFVHRRAASSPVS
jgi:hypothetical protein